MRRSVFISATTDGFSGWRDDIRKILERQGIEALVQDYFAPELEHCQIEMERKISSASGVICLVGPYYGAPMGAIPADGGVRMSYTQYEWTIAKKYDKPMCVYLIEDKFFSCGSPGAPQAGAQKKPNYPDSMHFDRSQKEFWELVSRDTETVNGHRRRIGTPVELALCLAMINWNIWPLQR